LDEPMSGLDPFGRRDVRELILEQRERGVTVLFSSHILPDVEMLCDRVAIVLAGRLQRVATVADLIHSDAHAVVLRCAGHPLVEIPAGLADQVTRLDRHDETQFMLQDSSRLDEMLGWALHAGVRIEAVTPQRASLEDLFMSAAGAASNRQERRTA
jgi:ABC-2 type transport system ATP-binding protein